MAPQALAPSKAHDTIRKAFRSKANDWRESAGRVRSALAGMPTTRTINAGLLAWFQGRNGLLVETYQVGASGKPWASGPRRIDARRQTYVTLGTSRRDFSGLRVVANDDRHLLVQGEHETILFRIAASHGAAVAA